MKLEFSRQIFLKKFKCQIPSKLVQWEPSCSMRTDVTKLIVAFHTFANAPKNAWKCLLRHVLTAWCLIKQRDKFILLFRFYGGGILIFNLMTARTCDVTASLLECDAGGGGEIWWFVLNKVF
jgi:hypothetical protein